MLEQNEKAAKPLDIDIGKMWLDSVRPLVKERKKRNRIRKEMK